MIEFKDLKTLIQKVCRSEQSEDINSRFKFIINVEKLEKSLSSKSDLHVMAFTKDIVSYVPTVQDIQLISEYVHKREELQNILDGQSQIAEFMLFCDKEGELKCENEDGVLDQKMIFEMTNGSEDQLNKELITIISADYPIYRILIVRRFNKRREKFEYAIYFRSNYNMITYIKCLREAGKFGNFEPGPDDPIDESEGEE